MDLTIGCISHTLQIRDLSITRAYWKWHILFPLKVFIDLHIRQCRYYYSKYTNNWVRFFEENIHNIWKIKWKMFALLFIRSPLKIHHHLQDPLLIQPQPYQYCHCYYYGVLLPYLLWLYTATMVQNEHGAMIQIKDFSFGKIQW